MSTIRTTRFGSVDTPLTTFINLYTVPAGKRALIRSFGICNNRAVAAIGILEIVTPGGAPVRVAAASHSVNAGQSLETDPWFVAEAGEVIRVRAVVISAGNVMFHVAGVLFDLP